MTSIDQGQDSGPALHTAAAGWPVLPCYPDNPDCPTPGKCRECKAPLTPHGVLDATTDPATIRAWWRRWPTANVAIATGAPGPDVLDVDVKPAGNGWAAFNRLKTAGLLTGARMLVCTPSGGLHVYFQGTGQPSGSLIRAGHFIEMKATGGYVLAPPSRVHGKPYQLLDVREADGLLDWQAVRRLLDPPSALPVSRPGRTGGTAGLVAFVAGLTEGNRNNGLYWAACRMVEAGNTAGLDQLVAASTLAEAEARRTVASAARRAAR
jgi:Bifunctional DNA primase/polymerase, N-terminal